MSGDDMLETLQADVLAILKAVPSLADVNIIAEDDGDMEAKIMRKLGTLTKGSTDKPGSVAVVMLPEVTAAEENLPGPPVNASVRVQVIEQSTINRATGGSGVRSSEGALRVLAALHLQTLGYAVLYAAAKPVEPVEVKKGFLSHMVTLSLNYRGLQGPGKPAQVTAEMVAGVNIIVSGAGDVAANGTYLPGEAMNGKPAFYKSGTNWFMGWETGFPDKWVIRDGSGNYPYVSSQDVASPELVTAWDVIGLSSPAPDVVLDPFLLSLACSTDGAAIRYTTDGSYPDATNGTLYTAPIALPEAGTVVRAAAYKTGLNPGDCTEIIVQP